MARENDLWTDTDLLEASEPLDSAGNVEAVRQASRQPLSEPVAALDSQPEDPLVQPRRQHQAPVTMMVILSAISLALGFGYIAWAVA